GLIEHAVRIITRQGEARTDIADAFAQAAHEELAEIGIPIAMPSLPDPHRLRIRVVGWDPEDATGAGGVVFVSANYQVVDRRGEPLWEVVQSRLPVRLSGPNLSRAEVGRVTRICVAQALASLPRPSGGGGLPTKP